jgi:hypothetical protein
VHARIRDIRAGGQRQHVAQDGHIDVIGTDTRQCRLKDEGVRGIDDIQRHAPDTSCHGYGPEEWIIEQAIHRPTE